MLLALAVGKLAQATFTSKIVVVIVPVVVTDDAGRTVTGLTRDRFHIFDEGREQPIATFAFGDSPVTLGLVLDGSASMRLELASAASSAIGRDIRQQYVLVFAPAGSPATSAIRQLRVTVDAPSRRKVIVRSRSSYSLADAGEP
jgi:hypothetical protein